MTDPVDGSVVVLAVLIAVAVAFIGPQALVLLFTL